MSALVLRDQIIILNLILSTGIFWFAARIYLLPKIKELAPEAILVPILFLHSMRHLGLMFLMRGAVYPGMPSLFATPAALGDFVTAILAFTAIPVVRRNFQAARLHVWIFNVVGTLDLLLAITLARVSGAAPFMGAAYWIPSFWVPALLVTHYITYIVLKRS